MQQADEANLSLHSYKTIIPAFELFTPITTKFANNDIQSINSFAPINTAFTNDTQSIDSFTTYDSFNDNNYESQQQEQTNSFDYNQNQNYSSDLNEIYYALDDYIDEVGDGVNLTKGKRVTVNKNRLINKNLKLIKD